MSSFFDFDEAIAYNEYKKNIYHHAASYNPPMRDPNLMLDVAKKLLIAVEKEKSEEKFDQAYYYTIKCLQLFDKDKNVKIPTVPLARAVFAKALDYSGVLDEGLQRQHQSILERIKAREPERQRILAKQLEADPHIAHNTRRQELLSSEQDALDQLRSALHGSNNDIVAPPPYHIDNTAEILSPPISTGVVKGIHYAQDYTRWKFNVHTNSPSMNRRGIVNLGNTCYMNSILQMINATPMAQYFLSDDYMSVLVTEEKKLLRLVNCFSFIIRELRRTENTSAVSTSPFKLAISELSESFNNYNQQDANEFLRMLLDSLHSGLNKNSANALQKFPEIDNTTGSDEELSRKFWWQYSQRNDSVIRDFCAFLERSSVRCPSCGHSSRSFAPTFGIEVPICTSAKISLEDCLALYCGEEILGEHSLYLCANCKNKVRATKQLLFYSAPKILFITLKRFRTYGDFSNLAKVNDEVVFHEKLDLAPFMCGSFSKTKYSLVSIVNHQGNMHGGHYTSDARGTDGVWCNFSDERVTMSEVPDFGLAYVLCYVQDD